MYEFDVLVVEGGLAGLRAALAWSLRFLDDARTTDKEARLASEADMNGAPDCEFIYNCVRVCPKSVAPAAAIRILRDRLKA